MKKLPGLEKLFVGSDLKRSVEYSRILHHEQTFAKVVDTVQDV